METPSDHVPLPYQDVPVALDASRRLDAGQPSLHARMLHELAPRPGDRVVHVGAGAGHHTALLASLVGPRGSVHAFEIDAALARSARVSLRDHARVELVHGSGADEPSRRRRSPGLRRRSEAGGYCADGTSANLSRRSFARGPLMQARADRSRCRVSARLSSSLLAFACLAAAAAPPPECRCRAPGGAQRDLGTVECFEIGARAVAMRCEMSTNTPYWKPMDGAGGEAGKSGCPAPA